MSNKVYIIWGILIITIYFLASNSVNDNYTIKNGKTTLGRFVGFSGGSSYMNGWVQYMYKGEVYESLNIHQGVRFCFNKGDELLIQIDTLNPEKFIYMPDTFVAFYDTFTKSKKLRFDTLIAYDLDLDPFYQKMRFKVDYKGRVYEMGKLTRIDNENDSLYYIFVNGWIRQGFLKPIKTGKPKKHQ